MDEKLRRRHGPEVDTGVIVSKGPVADGGAGAMDVIAGPDTVVRRNKRTAELIEVMLILCACMEFRIHVVEQCSPFLPSSPTTVAYYTKVSQYDLARWDYFRTCTPAPSGLT